MSVREFRLPDLGEGLEDAEVVAWRVAEGEHVALNQVVVEVNTAKALVEIPAPWEGTVERLHAEPGQVVRVGDALLSMRVEGAEGPPGRQAGDAGESRAERPARRPVLVGYGVDEEEEIARARRRRAAGSSADSRPAAARSSADSGPAASVRATPPVRRLARELGVDLAAVRATGPDGRVRREDVLRAAASATEGRPKGRAAAAATGPEAATGPPLAERRAAEGRGREDRTIPVRGTRRLIAERMTRSAREIPQVTTFLTADATWVLALRDELSSDSGERLSPLPVVVRAFVEVCRAHPKLNASFAADRAEILLHGACHVGIATDTEQGLLVPVVRDAGGFGIIALAGEVARLADAARAGRARPDELTGSTITVTNVGTFGAEYGTPLVNPPEAAILAIGVVEPRPMVVEGRVEPRPAVTLALTFDHRVMDGAEAGRALRDLRVLLESPFRLGALPR